MPGTPTGTSFGITPNAEAAQRLGVAEGVALHPSFLYEIAFHAVAFVLLWTWLRHRPLAPGTTFVLYVAAYGVFRFFVEFVRGNEVVWQGLTRPQLFLALTVPIVLVRIVVLLRRSRTAAPPPTAVPRAQEVSA